MASNQILHGLGFGNGLLGGTDIFDTLFNTGNSSGNVFSQTVGTPVSQTVGTPVSQAVNNTQNRTPYPEMVFGGGRSRVGLPTGWSNIRPEANNSINYFTNQMPDLLKRISDVINGSYGNLINSTISGPGYVNQSVIDRDLGRPRSWR